MTRADVTVPVVTSTCRPRSTSASIRGSRATPSPTLAPCSHARLPPGRARLGKPQPLAAALRVLLAGACPPAQQRACRRLAQARCGAVNLEEKRHAPRPDRERHGFASCAGIAAADQGIGALVDFVEALLRQRRARPPWRPGRPPGRPGSARPGPWRRGRKACRGSPGPRSENRSGGC